MTLIPPLTPPKLPEIARADAYIGGCWISEGCHGRMAVTDPATGAELASVPRMGRAETEAAIDAAEAAFGEWSARTAGERAAILHAWANEMRRHASDLALILTLEQGKPVAESRIEIEYAASFLTWFAEEGRRLYGDIIPAHRRDARILVQRAALGVTGGITPWNFPAAMVTRKAAPALAAGNVMVLKPAEATPLSALAIAGLAEAAGVPPGVFNVVTGAREDAAEIGATLTASRKLRKIGFTGSTAVGKELMRACAGNLTKISLELGGNAAFMVFDDADLKAAVDGAFVCKFRNTGQTCISANRILVQEAIYPAFLAALKERAAAIRLGHGTEAGVEMGPLIDTRGRDKVERLVADALDKGARLELGGQRHANGGTFYQPTVLTEITREMDITHQEVFGPVAAIATFKDEAEAIAMANDTPYGLAGYFYSRDVGRIFRVAEALQVGIVGVNTGVISTEVAPFGGMKESGIGREGSKYGIEDWTELKYICIAGI